MAEGRINIDVPRYNQSTYWGRATHFAVTTNPLNLFATPAVLDRSKDIVTRTKVKPWPQTGKGCQEG